MAKTTGRNWQHEIDLFTKGKNKTRTIEMGSPGSAQVTATRLRADFDFTFDIVSSGHKVIFER